MCLFLPNAFFQNVLFCVHIAFLYVCEKQFHAQAFIIHFCHLVYDT